MNEEERVSDERLTRLEKKIDDLIEIVIQLARVEEKVLFQNEGLKRLGDKLDEQEKRFGPLERNLAVVAWVERVAWFAITVALTAWIGG